MTAVQAQNSAAEQRKRKLVAFKKFTHLLPRHLQYYAGSTVLHPSGFLKNYQCHKQTIAI